MLSTSVVCFVLLESLGEMHTIAPYYPWVLAVLALAALSARYIPDIFHRPHTAIDSLCKDMLCLTAHCACACLVHSPTLRYACALHSACYLLQFRFAASFMILYIAMALCLVGAYMHGPRLLEVRDFIAAIAFPSAVELVAALMGHIHRLVVLWMVVDE